MTKVHERTCHKYQTHKYAYLVAPSNYSNPLLQTCSLSKSFQKGPPKKTYGKCRHSHNHDECPVFGTVCIGCGKKNHWVQQCRSSGRRHSSSGCTPSPRRPQQQRQRRPSGKQFKQGKGQGRGGSNNSTVAGNLSEPTHPPKVDDGPVKEVVSIKADPSGPAHPPKTIIEYSNNTFTCDALQGNGNEETWTCRYQ